ncbi:MAG: thiazole biosynthesis adenylyltransferase ThiF [Planctomycetes bacterium]|nr:thiazole biosynthesis adenylyltransferase ThiF [Planctomycetota bacterium]
MRFEGIGKEGQQHIANSSVLLCGCGALGTVLADTLVRAGVGRLRIVDRDFVDLSNLQRQVLFDEQDVADHLPKSIVAARKLGQINSQVTIEPLVIDIDWRNIRELTSGVDLILDGTDNFETRFLINDVSLETGIPWVYAGVVGSHGQTMPIFPNESACLRCLIESPPDPGSMETCDTAGVIAPAVHMVTSLQSATALKILSGNRQKVVPQLTIVDVWEGTFRQIQLSSLFSQQTCLACGPQKERQWLNGHQASQSTVLCGRNSVQVSPGTNSPGSSNRIELSDLAGSLAMLGTVTQNPFLIRFQPTGQEFQITIFRDGRAIIQGTEDPTVARSLYTRYIGL